MWKWAGWLFVALGAVGVLLPIMPTVPFLLLAAYCFEKGSPELSQWLLQHKTYGPPLVAWKEHRAIGLRAKIWATLTILMSLTYVVVFREFAVWLKTGLVIVCLSILAFILTRKSRAQKEF